MIGSLRDSPAAGALRTLLLGIEGELLDLVRRPKEKNLPWPTAVERLRSSDPTTAWAYEQVGRREKIHRELCDELSNVLKMRREGQMEALWSRTLDHLDALLSAVELLRRSSKDADQPVPVR